MIILLFKFPDEMNDLAYDIGVPNRVVQADRAEIPKFLHEDWYHIIDLHKVLILPRFSVNCQ